MSAGSARQNHVTLTSPRFADLPACDPCFPMNVISAPNFSLPTDSYVQHQQSLLFTWITKLFLSDDIEASFTSRGPPFLSTRLLDTLRVNRCNQWRGSRSRVQTVRGKAGQCGEQGAKVIAEALGWKSFRLTCAEPRWTLFCSSLLNCTHHLCTVRASRVNGQLQRE